MKFNFKIFFTLLILLLTLSCVNAADNDNNNVNLLSTSTGDVNALEVSTINTHINIVDTSVEEGIGENFTGYILDESNNPIIGHHLNLNLSRTSSGASKVYELVSDYNGEFRIPIFLAKGDYTAQVTYNGLTLENTVYSPSSAGPVNIEVVTPGDERLTTRILVSDFNKTYGDDTNLAGLLIDTNGNLIIGHHISVKLSRASNSQSKTYDVVTDYNGEFSMPINLGAGVYLGDISYAGTTLYKPTSAGTITITILNKEEDNDNEEVGNLTLASYNSTLLSQALSIDMGKWNYDSSNNIYYQLGLVYCVNPETTTYESLGLYVPGDYFTATQNTDGTYTCTVNPNGKVGNYTANTAPIVIPVNTPGYSALTAPTTYSASTVSPYTSAGIIYAYAGCRGRDNGNDFNGGAPWGVTDLKSAILYLKFNKDSIAGDTEKIFTFGHSGGGAQSTLVGTTGDSELYTPYLESIGAALVDKNGNTLSDSIYGAMAWCPITSLDYADEAYEWNLGQYANSGTRASTTWTSSLSKDLATEYAIYINNLGLKDANGNVLTLTETDTGIYTSGTYYTYLLSVIEESLNNFLEDTSFPYTPTTSTNTGGPGTGGIPTGGFGNRTDGPGGAPGNMSMGDLPNFPQISAGTTTTYTTAEEYINSLNTDETWVIYNNETNTVKITSIEAFINHCKSASKSVGAFDDLSRTQAENDLFGNPESNYLHFDKTIAKLLSENQEKYAQYSDYDNQYINAYNEDLTKLDALNNTIQYRVDMYNPMYYLCDYYDGYKTSNVAKHWRISTGITQGDTANTVEVNLALALNQYETVEDVIFQTVWNQGHTEAERTGSATTNFINWVNSVV